MFRKSSPPIEPRRFEAPTTATLEGSKNGRSEATTASWSRVDVLAIRLGRGDRELHLELAALELARQLESGGLEHA